MSSEAQAQRRCAMDRHLWLTALLIGLTLACGGMQSARRAAVPPTRTPHPTFTSTSMSSPTAPFTSTPSATLTEPPTHTLAPTPIATDTDAPTPTPVDTPTAVPAPPTPTPEPLPTDTATMTPQPEPIIRYVLADAQREFNCEHTAIYGTVSNANGFGLPGVTVRALGIKGTTGDHVAVTDAEGKYEIFRIPLEQLQAGEWAVMIVENGVEASERFHWASTPVCKSDDTGHSQVLRVDWKLIE